MKKILNRILYGIGITIFLITSACQAEVISQTEQRLERYAPNVKDFPKGWEFVSEDWGVNGLESYSVNYGATNKDFIGFGETITKYPDQEQAQNGYLERKEKWFDVGEEWPGTEFTPTNQNDEYQYKCLKIPMSTFFSCRFLQRHNEIVVLILVNIDDKEEAITISQFNEILKALDERLNTVTLD